MTLFSFFRRPSRDASAQTAKERLQILLAHERHDRSSPDYLPLLQKDYQYDASDNLIIERLTQQIRIRMRKRAF